MGAVFHWELYKWKDANDYYASQSEEQSTRAQIQVLVFDQGAVHLSMCLAPSGHTWNISWFVLFSSLTCGSGEAMDTELHQQILQMFKEESDEEDFLGFPASGMDEDSVVNLFTANNI